MKKGLVAIALALLSQPVFSQGLYLQEGCGVLSSVVEQSVFGVREGLSEPVNVGEFGLLRCARTAESTTSAFGRAMDRFGIVVRWSGGGIAPGDVCLSHRLSECYPEFDRRTAPLMPGELEFAVGRWTAIQRAVVSTLRQPSMPDFSVFQIGSLKDRIDAQLATTKHSVGRLLTR